MKCYELLWGVMGYYEMLWGFIIDSLTLFVAFFS